MNQMIRPSQTDQRPALETLAGSVERITFHNAENGFAVLKVHARGKRDLVTVVGHTPAVSAGEWITASGLWISDRTHGLQFKAEVLKTTPPTGAEGIESVDGMGLMIGVKTVHPAREFAERLLQNGVLVTTAKDRIRLLPALNIPIDQLKTALQRFCACAAK